MPSTSSSSSGTSEAAFESSCSAVEGDELGVPGRTSPSSRRPTPSTPPPRQQPSSQSIRARETNGAVTTPSRRGRGGGVDVDSSSAGPSASGSFVHKVTMEELLSPSFNGIVAADQDSAVIVTPKELSPPIPAAETPTPTSNPPATSEDSLGPIHPRVQNVKKRKGRAFSVLFQRFSAAKTGFIRRNRRDSQTTPSKEVSVATPIPSPAMSTASTPSASSPAPESSASNPITPAVTTTTTTTTTPSSSNGEDVPPFSLKDTPGAPLAETLLKPSTTRLRTLPPKDPKEEAKHLKMRKQMEKQYLKKMKREEKAERESTRRQARREALMQKNTRTWMDNVLPNWDKHYDSKLLRNLIRQGVPTHLRGAVWPMCIGNSLGLTHELYRIYSDRADRVAERVKLQRELREKEKEKIRRMAADQTTSSTADDDDDDDDLDEEYDEVFEERERANTLERTELETLDMIALDIPRTFPDLQFYQQAGPQQDLLRCVLHAFVCYRPDIGYVQGMSYLAGMLLLHIDDPAAAFNCLANILNTHFFPGFLRMDVPTIVSHLRTFSYLLKEAAPKVYKRFLQMELVPEMYMIDWLVTLFAKALPLDIASRIWDSYFLDGEVVVHRVAIAILKMHTSLILDGSFEEIMLLFNDLHEIDEEVLFDTIESYQLSPKKFDAILQSHIKQEQATRANSSASSVDVVSTAAACAVPARPTHKGHSASVHVGGGNTGVVRGRKASV